MIKPTKHVARSPLTLLLFIAWSMVSATPAHSQTHYIITSIAGSASLPAFGGDGGPATAATLDFPHDVAVDHAGNKYVVDEYNHRVRKISSSGIITTIAGNSAMVGYGSAGGFGGDGGPATAATLNRPLGIAIDGSGNIYVADGNNFRVRKINSAGIISTIAGTGTMGYSGDGGPATSASITFSLATTSGGSIGIDAAGNVYFADGIRNHIRKIDAAGIITTFAGTGTAGFSGDGGPATAATLNVVESIAFDQIGNAYIVDASNHRIRKIDPAGIISTFAGNGPGSVAGIGGPATAATLGGILAVATDTTGNVFISALSRIFKVDTSGIVTAFAGNVCGGWAGDHCAATASPVCMQANGIRVDDAGNLYIADTDDEHVRKIGRDATPWFVHGPSQFLTLCEGSGADSINSLLAVLDSDGSQTETWSVIASPMHGLLSASYTTTSTGDTLHPVGLYYTPATGYLGTDSFKIRVIDCGGSSDSTTIYVTVISPVSIVTESGPSTLCVGATATFSASYAGGAWTSSNPSVATVGSSTGTVTGIAAGVVIISYVLTPSCGTPPATTSITINPMPSAGLISGRDTLCVGSEDSLIETISGGVWSITNAHASIGSTGLLLGISVGADTVIYTVTALGCSASKKVEVYVLPHGSCPWLAVSKGPQSYGLIDIYPNPSPGDIFVTCSEAGEVRICNIHGQQVCLYKVREGKQELHLPGNLVNGVYVVEYRAVTGFRNIVRLVLNR